MTFESKTALQYRKGGTTLRCELRGDNVSSLHHQQLMEAQPTYLPVLGNISDCVFNVQPQNREQELCCYVIAGCDDRVCFHVCRGLRFGNSHRAHVGSSKCMA
jgi:hypothetical protein